MTYEIDSHLDDGDDEGMGSDVGAGGGLNPKQAEVSPRAAREWVDPHEGHTIPHIMQAVKVQKVEDWICV
jgi:hypothetical protein